MNIRIILKIIIVILFIGIQVYHILNEGFLMYPCISWGRTKETPLITTAWIVIILLIFYIVLKNNKIDRKLIYIGFIFTVLLIVSSNLDYGGRKIPDETNMYTYIHHALSFICLVYMFAITYKYYPIYMRYIIIFLLVSFFSLHQSWYTINYSKDTKFSIKKILTVLELIIIISIITTKLLNY